MKVRGDVELSFGTVKGPVRSDNQDDFVVYEPADDRRFARDGRLIAVADGMGGGPGGAEASRVALRTLLSGYLDAADSDEAAGRLLSAFRRACDAVARESARHPSLEGMGTTLTAVVVRDGRIDGVHVGDSRCMIAASGRGRWLTDLHLGEDGGHGLTRAVGAGHSAEEPETFSALLGDGDHLLLMTDGVWRAVTEEECLATIAAAPGAAVEQLLARAQEADGSDNATVVLMTRKARRDAGATEVEAVEAEARPGVADVVPPARLLARIWPWLLLGLGVVLGAAAYLLD